MLSSTGTTSGASSHLRLGVEAVGRTLILVVSGCFVLMICKVENCAWGCPALGKGLAF